MEYYSVLSKKKKAKELNETKTKSWINVNALQTIKPDQKAITRSTGDEI